jgi:tetratricopeptide (TPR) repeat protein
MLDHPLQKAFFAMNNQSLTAKRLLLNTCSLLLVLLFINSAGAAIQEPDYESLRKQAFDLLNQSKMMEALPVLEKLVARNPDDSEVRFFLGFCLVARSREQKNPELRKKDRLAARTHLLRAKELGASEPVLQQLLDALPADGSEPVDTLGNSKARAALDEGESAYARGELDKALAAYARAFELDPKLYEAALFAGDMQFKRAHGSTDVKERKSLTDSAGEWFAKAIALDPDRETAYRYWGDALLEDDRDELALAKFVDAIVADPYNRLVYNGISRWSQKHQKRLGHPRIDIPTNVTSNKPGEINITVDDLSLKGSNDDGSAAWMMYGISRSLWVDTKDGKRSEKFAKAYPKETAYRHSLAEEMDGLTVVIESVETQTKEKRIKTLTPSLENLMKLHKAGLLEAYILFVKPDNGIVRDYASYRAANRDKLRRYWVEVVVGGS